MNLTRKVSTTTYPIVFMMVDSTDHVTGETGLTPTVTLSKNGGGYAAAAGAVSEIANGLYALAGNATDRDTLGELWVHADGGAGVDKADFKVDIVSHDPYGDISEILTDTGTTIPGLLDAIKGAGWTDETLVALMTAVESGTVDEATIRSAIGLSTANLDTQLSTIDSEIGTIYSEMASVDDVWDEALSGHTTTGSAGKVLSDIPTTLSTTGVVLTAAGLADDAVTKIQSGLALEATLTAIKGAGWSTETLTAIDVLIDAIKAKTDALDNSAVTFVTAVSGSTITILRGDTFSGVLTNIGALTDYVSIDFTVKEAYSKTDDEATIRIRKNASGTDDGLMRLNGAAATSSALGSIAIDDLATGDITITLDETATDDLSTGTYVYDIQLITASSVKTLTSGKLVVTADVTRLVA